MRTKIETVRIST